MTTIYSNKNGYMTAIDNNEYCYFRSTDELGNCMYNTARRLNNYVRKYGVNNFALYLMVCIDSNNKYVCHTAIYNKIQNKIIDVSNGRIILMNFDDYNKQTLKNTKKHLFFNYYLNTNYLIITKKDLTKSKIILDDNTIKKFNDDELYEMIQDIIKSKWNNMKIHLYK
jgi:hypothetical protein